MVRARDLKPGMRIKIVDDWTELCIYNPDGLMDHWLGQIVSVLRTEDTPDNGTAIIIEEDVGEYECTKDGHWYWYESSIECIVGDANVDELEPANDDELAILLGF